MYSINMARVCNENTFFNFADVLSCREIKFVTRNGLKPAFLFRFELFFVNRSHSKSCLLFCLINYVSMFLFVLISPVACQQI